MKRAIRHATKLAGTLILAAAVSATAQEPQANNKKESLNKERMEFLTKWMELTPQEQEKFTKIHEEFHTQMKQLHQQRKELMEKIRSAGKEISDQDAEQLLKELTALHQKMESLRADLIEQIKRELGARKALLFITGEHAYRKQKAEEHKEEHQSH